MTRVAKVLAAIAVVLFAVPAVAAADPLRTLAAFDRGAGETPENLAIAPDGTIYISLADAGEIRRIAPDGTQATVSIPTMGGITVGVAIDRHHNDDLDVAVRSEDSAVAGIWRVPSATFANPTRIVALPADSFPNGITFDPAGNLYVADSSLGAVWRVPRGSTQAAVWSESPLLAPTGAEFMGLTLPGANGAKVNGGFLYVSNTAAGDIVRIPIQGDGRSGPVQVRFTGIEPDDFAFAANRDLYVAENLPSEIVRIAPDGRTVPVATQSDGLDNPSAVAFDPRPHRRTQLLVTNSAYFVGSHASLQETGTDTVGQRLP